MFVTGYFFYLDILDVTHSFESNPIVARLVSLVCQTYPFVSFTETLYNGIVNIIYFLWEYVS